MSGRTTKNINRETMMKVWTLWGEQVSKGTIAAVTGISKASVTRIVDIMTFAKAHEIDKLREYYHGGYIAQKKTACNFFGYEFERAPRVIYQSDDYRAVEIVPATFEQLTTDAFIKAGIEFNLSKANFEKPTKSATGYMSGASATGDYSGASATGYMSGAMSVGDECRAEAKNNSVALVVGADGIAKGDVGSFIVLSEVGEDEDGNAYIKDVRAVKVDGERIKADTFYKLVNGEFVEA